MKRSRIKSLGLKSLAVGSCLLLFTTSAALAQAADEPRTLPAQIEPAESLERGGPAQIDPAMPIDRGASQPGFEGTGTSSFDGYGSEALREKHKEVDHFIFKENDGVFDGFKVTNTGPLDDRIEIGIIPYDDSHAAYLYEQLGKELIKVVEGFQAYTTDMGNEMTIIPVGDYDRDVNEMDQPVSTNNIQPDILISDGEQMYSTSGSGENTEEFRTISAADSAAMESAATAAATDSSPNTVLYYAIGAIIVLLAAGAVMFRKIRLN